MCSRASGAWEGCDIRAALIYLEVPPSRAVVLEAWVTYCRSIVVTSPPPPTSRVAEATCRRGRSRHRRTEALQKTRTHRDGTPARESTTLGRNIDVSQTSHSLTPFDSSQRPRALDGMIRTRTRRSVKWREPIRPHAPPSDCGRHVPSLQLRLQHSQSLRQDWPLSRHFQHPSSTSPSQSLSSPSQTSALH